MSDMIRAVYRTVCADVADAQHQAVIYRLIYPASYSATDYENATGDLPIRPSDTPSPVFIMMGGINVNPDSYRELARQLADAGFVVMLYSYVGRLFGDAIGLSPGLDLGALTPDVVGTRPSATLLRTLIDELHRENDSPMFAGMLDTSRVILGGHSAGGTVALLNANRDWFPEVCGVATYGSHTQPAQALGYSDHDILAVGSNPRAASTVPVCLIGGTEDGVIASSAGRYGNTEHHRIRATYEAVPGASSKSYVLVNEANHLSMCQPLDEMSARGFLETQPIFNASIFEVICGIFTSFCCDVASGDAQLGSLRQACTHSMVAEWEVSTP